MAGMSAGPSTTALKTYPGCPGSTGSAYQRAAPGSRQTHSTVTGHSSISHSVAAYRDNWRRLASDFSCWTSRTLTEQLVDGAMARGWHTHKVIRRLRRATE